MHPTNFGASGPQASFEQSPQMSSFLGLGNLKIGARLGLGFALVLVMLLALTALGIHRVSNINTSLSTIGDVNSVKQRYAINFRGSVHDRAIAIRDVTLEQSKDNVQTQLALIAKLAEDYAKSAAPLDQMFATRDAVSDDERAALATIKEIEAKTLPLTAKVAELKLAGKGEEAIQLLLTETRPA